VYGGKRINETVYDERIYSNGSDGIVGNTANQYLVNTSPIDFFEPNHKGTPMVKRFPHYESAQRWSETLKRGDCIFIPAFVFYQYRGNNMKEH
jgi:hypothetical protein